MPSTGVQEKIYLSLFGGWVMKMEKNIDY